MKTLNIPQIWLAQDFAKDLNFSEQCNCACAYNPRSVSANEPGYLWTEYKPARVHAGQLASGYHVLFGLDQPGGLAVLNDAAYQLWEEIKSSTKTLSDPGSVEFKQDLLRAGLLLPPGSRLTTASPETLTAWLHVTNRCNLGCDYCFVEKNHTDMELACGLTAIDALICSARQQNMKKLVLKFAGGEPSLRMDLVLELLAYARKQAAQTELTLKAVLLTNGTLMNQEMIEAIGRNNIQVSISLDGIGESHNRQRPFPNGRGSFVLVDRAIERLCGAGIKPFVSITLTPANIEHLPELVDYVLQRQLPFNINFFRDHECSGVHTPLAFDEQKTIALLKLAMKQIEAHLPENFSLLGELLDRTLLNSPRAKACGVGESYVVIDPLGRISRCHMDMKNPLANIHSSDILAEIRAEKPGLENINVDEKPDCKTCTWRYACAGGCPLEAYRSSGKFDSRSPNCNIYRQLFPEIIRLEGLRLMTKAGLTN